MTEPPTGARPTPPPAHRAAGRAEPAEIAERRPSRVTPGEVLLGGVAAGMAGAAAMAATVMGISEISSESTFAQGIDSSTWTPITGIAAFVFGLDAFHGDFHVLPILAGLAIHLGVSVAFGIAGLALIVATQGPQPGPVGAAVQGFAYGLFLQVFVLNAAVNSIQDAPTVYESMPQWGWWVGHAFYGIALGLGAWRLLGRPPSG